MPVYTSIRCEGCDKEYSFYWRPDVPHKTNEDRLEKYFRKAFPMRKDPTKKRPILSLDPRHLCRKCLRKVVKVGKVIEKVLFRSALAGKPRLTKALATCLFRHFESESGSVDKVYVSPKRFQDLRSRFLGWTGNEFDPERRYATIKATKCFGWLWGAGVFPQKAVSPCKIVLLNKRVALTYSLITGKCFGPFEPRGDWDGSDTGKKE